MINLMTRSQINIFLLLYVTIINIILSHAEECSRELPIKVGDNCLSTYCSESQFKKGECNISNQIIKTQWLNNIILVGEKDFRYINFMSSSKGEMIFITSSYPTNRNRIFFGINSQGSPIFKDSNGSSTYIIKKTVTRESGYDRIESETGSIKINNDSDKNKEYFISIGKSETYTEIFDYIKYEKNIIEMDYLTTIFYNTEIYSGCLINYFENDNNYYFYCSLRGDKKNYYFNLIKLSFTYDSNRNISCNNEISSDYQSLNKKIVNCYLTESNLLCLYISNNNQYIMILFNTSLAELYEKELQIYSNSNVLTFFKFFHLKDNIGVFTYYQGIDNDYPIIQFIESNVTGNDYNISLSSKIHLNQSYFNNGVMLTDIIKIKDSLICLTSTSLDKETLIIVLIHIFNGMKYNIRYYLIDIFKLYNHKFLTEMKLHLYNNITVFAFSFCESSTCNGDNDEHYSSLIFFSYPNITDYNLDLINYLNEEQYSNIIINLFDYVRIDNNIFGLIFYAIKIYSISNCGMDYLSKKNNKIIKENDYLSTDENLTLNFTRDEYGKINCSISYSLIITEPEYNEYNKYPNYILNKKDENEENNFKNNFYEGKVGYFNILINQEITKNCEKENFSCSLCLQNNKSHCLLFPNNDTFFTFFNDDTEIPLNNNSIYKLIEDVIIGNYKNISLTDKELKDIYNYIKDEILGKKNYNLENLILQTSEVVLQLSTLEDQKNQNLFISSIDLKECEEKLKIHYNIKNEDDLIVLKTDIKTEDSLTTYVQYEIYEPYTLSQLNLSYCKESEITINVPVNLDYETISLYRSLNQSGYNLFDSNDSFYNDICTTYTSENNTDIIISDRKNIIYMNNGNKVLCQNGCNLKNYNLTTKKAQCKCSVQEEVEATNFHEYITKFDKNILADSFLKTLKNSNFLVLKCYKLVFNITNIKKNIGMIIMTIILILSIILIFIYSFKEYNQIKYFIQSIIKIKFSTYIFNKKSFESIKTKGKNKDKNININKNKNNIIEKIQEKKNNNKKNLISIHKKNKNTKIKFPPKRNNLSKKIPLKESTFNEMLKVNSGLYLKKKKKITKKHEILTKRKECNKISKDPSTSTFNFIKIKQRFNLEKNNSLNDKELNTLNYELALEKDKRTYFQFYWSLLKKKHLILFTFLPANDYNLLTIKISLFLFSFSLSFTINGFFFTDETMNNIYKNNGNYDFIYQIEQILYSTIICGCINIIIKNLSLSENNILEIKEEKALKDAVNKSKEIEHYIKLKIIIFYIISLLFLFFFWYFISCFCIVYNNTQIILIEDTLFSFILSMLYPFGLNLLPGIFRILALRAKNKDKKCLYKFSLLLALI